MRGPVVLCWVVVALAPGVFAQTSLNPTVKVLARPTSVVPPECEQGLAPAVPRPPVETAAAIAPVATTAEPPTSDLRTRLRAVQATAESNDYNGFKSALAEARASVNAYPAGGEKQAANDVLQVYADLERLWDYAQTDPTGAFYNADSEGGAIVKALRKYPSFARAVADATMTVGGQTIYPSHETRQFLTEEAARRLKGIGIRTPARVVQERAATPAPRRAATPPPTRHTASGERRAATPPPARHTASGKRQAAKAPVKVAEASPKPVPQPPPATTTASSVGQRPSAVVSTTAAAPTATEKTAMPAIAAPIPTTPTTATTPAAATTVPATTTFPSTTSASTTSASTTSAPKTTTTESAAPATTSSATEKQEPAQAGGMNLTFAIILIVVGIGVLIVLFRSSD